jgi:hypothetical protein
MPRSLLRDRPIAPRPPFRSERARPARVAPQGWNQTEQDSGQHGESQSEQQQAAIHSDIDFPWQRKRRNRRLERCHSGVAHAEADQAARQREQHVFGQKLADETPACDTQCRAYGHLAVPRGTARQGEVGQVGHPIKRTMPAAASNTQRDRRRSESTSTSEKRSTTTPHPLLESG